MVILMESIRRTVRGAVAGFVGFRIAAAVDGDRRIVQTERINHAPRRGTWERSDVAERGQRRGRVLSRNAASTRQSATCGRS